MQSSSLAVLLAVTRLDRCGRVRKRGPSRPILPLHVGQCPRLRHQQLSVAAEDRLRPHVVGVDPDEARHTSISIRIGLRRNPIAQRPPVLPRRVRVVRFHRHHQRDQGLARAR